jgi:hypothetical protein
MTGDYRACRDAELVSQDDKSQFLFLEMVETSLQTTLPGFGPNPFHDTWDNQVPKHHVAVTQPLL